MELFDNYINNNHHIMRGEITYIVSLFNHFHIDKLQITLDHQSINLNGGPEWWWLKKAFQTKDETFLQGFSETNWKCYLLFLYTYIIWSSYLVIFFMFFSLNILTRRNAYEYIPTYIFQIVPHVCVCFFITYYYYWNKRAMAIISPFFFFLWNKQRIQIKRENID